MQHAFEWIEAVLHSLSMLYFLFYLYTTRYGIAFLPYYDFWIVTLKWRLLLIWGNYSHYKKVKTLGSCPFCILSLWCIFICPGVNIYDRLKCIRRPNIKAITVLLSSQGCLHLVTASSLCPHCILTHSIADDLSGFKFSSVSSCIKMTDYQLLMKD